MTKSDGRSKKRPGLGEQKSSVLKAAVPLFIECGTKDVTISQICERAEVTRPTFYRCFTDKDDLLHELYQNSVNKAVEDILMRRVKESGRGLEWIKASLFEVYDAIFEQPDMADLLFREANDPSSSAYTIINEAFDNIAKTLLKSAGITKNKTVAVVYLKSIMVANQWIVHDAITKGATAKSKKVAKEACWLMVSKLFANDEL